MLFVLTDKQSFLEANQNNLHLCNKSTQYVWKDVVCDTRKDCLGGSEEGNCEKRKYFSS